MKPHETVTGEQTAAGLQWLSQSKKDGLSGIKSIEKSALCNTHADIQTRSGLTHTIHFPLWIEKVGSEKG